MHDKKRILSKCFFLWFLDERRNMFTKFLVAWVSRILQTFSENSLAIRQTRVCTRLLSQTLQMSVLKARNALYGGRGLSLNQGMPTNLHIPLSKTFAPTPLESLPPPPSYPQKYPHPIQCLAKAILDIWGISYVTWVKIVGLYNKIWVFSVKLHWVLLKFLQIWVWSWATHQKSFSNNCCISSKVI